MGSINGTNQVRAWRERVEIPTYGIGSPESNPMFLESRVYQGSSGVVYPLPVIERVEDECRPQAYDAVYLENEYLKLMILPQLGGRVQLGLDKTNNYNFIYHNRVIKPALVGLTGPWISGGIEFNWPQHHRPSTFMPLDHDLMENPDGSWTVWCHEIDRMYGTRAMHGLTLHPRKAYLEVKVRISNRTQLPQTFLWWANPAVHVDENHQSIFPPDVCAVMDHGKRDVSSFPIARGVYYKVNYAPGTDISRYKNLSVPTSYMAHRSDYDFVGSYDHRRQAGLLHVANHHISPGKKQWTWGNSDFGRAWDRQLTDDDGPYVELMCGVYTDNQPDFSWLMPGEQKSFSQFFMPYKGVGMVKNATVDAAVGLEICNRKATARAYTTSRFPGAHIILRRGAKVLADKIFDGSPEVCRTLEVSLDSLVEPHELQIAVTDAAGRSLVSYTPDVQKPAEIPQPAKAIPEPAAIDSNESLYLAGQHLEQYRHATRQPAHYYREALRRDAGDSRANLALGVLLLRRGQFRDAEKHLRAAVTRITRHNPNPIDGDTHYHLGTALIYQERYNEAYAAFYKSTWSAAQQSAAHFELARLALRRGDETQALLLLDECRARNALHHQATHLKIYLLLKAGQSEEARAILNCELAADPFNTGAIYELARTEDAGWDIFHQRMRNDANNYIELAWDYALAGLYQRACDVLEYFLNRAGHSLSTPMVYYYLADFCRRRNQDQEAADHYALAAGHSPYLCFPNKLVDIGVLQSAIEHNPNDARALYYLGNLWYDRRQYDLAIDCWTRSCELDPSFSTAWRNLGLAYYNQREDADEAWAAYAHAWRLDTSDARMLFEFDQLAKRRRIPAIARLERLEQHFEVVQARDDLFLEYVQILNQLGRHQEALGALLDRRFHAWEGGEGKVSTQYMLALTQMARAEIEQENFDQAIVLLRRAESWPESLGEGKLPGARENNIHYLLGVAYEGVAESTIAASYFDRAADSCGAPTSATYYNDQPPDMIFYEGLALRALGRERNAQDRFRALVAYGTEHLDDVVVPDFFAVSLPDFLVFHDDLSQRNRIHCRYMRALGHLGLRENAKATDEFENTLRMDPNHIGAVVHQNWSLRLTRQAV